MSKEEIMNAIRKCAEELGHPPTVADLRDRRKIGVRAIRRYFGSYTEALRATGFDPHGAGYRLDMTTLFKEWARVARQLGRIPSVPEYSKLSRYSVGPLIKRCGGWTEVPRSLLVHAREKGLEKGWEDVLEMIEAHENGKAPATRRLGTATGRGKKNGPIYGNAFSPVPMVHAPTNEMGVVCLFGMLAATLGFLVTRIQSEFPDCEVMREVEKGRWQRIRAEFEHESRNFVLHQHNPAECDVIICWVHNWRGCPKEIQVIELSSEMRRIFAVELPE